MHFVLGVPTSRSSRQENKGGGFVAQEFFGFWSAGILPGTTVIIKCRELLQHTGTSFGQA